MRVLVTGGAGFIGSHLVAALLRRGDAVRVLDDFSTGVRARLAAMPEAEVVEGDVRDAGAVRRACAGVDAVLHQAAQVSVPRSVEDPRTTADVNVCGLVTVLSEARNAGAERFVLASSCAVYGDSALAVQSEDDAPRPVSPYAASKLAGEAFVHAAAHERGGMLALSLRYFNVYGAGQARDSAYAAVVPAFVDALRSGRRPVVFGDGRQSRDLVHVGDVVRANLAALAAPEEARGLALNVGTGRAMSVIDLLAAIARTLGAPADADRAPGRPGDVMRSLASVERTGRVLGFRATTTLDEGLAETVGGHFPAGGAPSWLSSLS